MTAMRRTAAFLVALVLAFLGSLGVRAQQQPADQTELTFRAGINFVTVDAYVSDSKGQPATDLKQSDFEVFEDNKPQKIDQFRFIKVDGNPKPGEPPPQEIRNRDDEEREAARADRGRRGDPQPGGDDRAARAVGTPRFDP